MLNTLTTVRVLEGQKCTHLSIKTYLKLYSEFQFNIHNKALYLNTDWNFVLVILKCNNVEKIFHISISALTYNIINMVMLTTLPLKA